MLHSKTLRSPYDTTNRGVCGRKPLGLIWTKDEEVRDVVDLVHRAQEAKKWRALVETRKNSAVLHQTREIY